ncbi:MAG: ribonuclease VapC, partial [Sphingomonadales bacterium]|nr:ribonuclease VapC [Sphingomonadales bacterium]
MSVVLDSSAVLAALRKEAGADVVRDLLSEARVSAVNLAEIVGVLTRGNDADRVTEIIDEVGLNVSPADDAMAIDAGLLSSLTASAGLSLGDRFCLALARHLRLPVVTA